MLLPNYRHVSVLPSVQHVFFLPRPPGQGSHPFCAKPTHASGPSHMLLTLPSTVFSRKPHHVRVSFFLESVPRSHHQRALSWQPCINSIPLTLSHTPHSTFLQSTFHSLPYCKFTCLNVKTLSLSTRIVSLLCYCIPSASSSSIFVESVKQGGTVQSWVFVVLYSGQLVPLALKPHLPRV